MSSVPSLAEVLRNTLERLESNEELAPDDPALAELRRTLVRTILEIEFRHQGKRGTAA